MWEKPEIIAFLRACYDDMPEWVGGIEGDVDYVGFLRSKGVALSEGVAVSDVDDAGVGAGDVDDAGADG